MGDPHETRTETNWVDRKVMEMNLIRRESIEEAAEEDEDRLEMVVT